ncbi:helix-turn-helix domain-containing protein [Haloarcula sediminis]|uniref:helix-turn-helix domain-containing protein n=1 Tax=Haloarcula sediminis TaxID=3111777 RepID=UPI002D795763|nr:helix-turn-helix domain-containing protein [Haloarcula sp. CK38]
MIVTFHIETGFLRAAAGRLPDGAVSIQRLHRVDGGCRASVWVDVSDRDTVDSALAGDDTAGPTSHLGPEAEGHWYAITTVDEPLDAMSRGLLTADGMLVRADLIDDEWVVQARFPDRSSLLTFREDLVADGFDVEVKRMREDEDEASTQFGVTDPQREVLLLALERGYYTVPRNASLSDLAAQLDISSQAASERLRRGTQTLVANTLAAPARPSIGSRQH